jgi:hypothetical protein
MASFFTLLPSTWSYDGLAFLKEQSDDVFWELLTDMFYFLGTKVSFKDGGSVTNNGEWKSNIEFYEWSMELLLDVPPLN